ncbi:MAG: response regulator [Bryobacterales bacterium]|nr:response regulator [Bryobacterales bacterium]
MRRYIAGLLVLGGLLWGLYLRRTKQPVVLRAGTNQSPQFNYRDDHGKITGFAVDVLEEAAGRVGYRLEWVFVDGSPDPPLAEGQVDIWPILSYVEERRRLIHLTRPWWKSDGALLTRADHPITAWPQLKGSAVRYSPAEHYLVQSIHWPEGIRLVMDPTSAEAMRHMCAGEGAGVWTLLHLQREYALRRPSGCEGVPLSTFQPTDATLPYALGANKGKTKEAEILRDAIEEMSREGRTMAIASHWRILDVAHSDLVGQMVGSHQRNIQLLYGLTGVAFLALFLGWLAARARVAKLAAERVSAARSQFLANMSHELRTPMNGVLAIIDLMMTSSLTNEQREQLLLARSSARSLLGVLNDILDFSRIDSGRLLLETIPFSPREVAERSARLVAGKAHAKRLELLFDVDPAVPGELVGDPVRLQQILLNLLGNAVKFTSHGWVRLRLRTEPAGERLWLICEVADTGIGIPPEKQAAIFESFTQADSTITRKYGGSGLGLSISSRLATMMQGELTLTSEEGKGSLFRFAGLFGRMPEDPADTGSELLRGKQVLVVDDRAEHGELVCGWLRSWQMHAVAAECGQAAMDLARMGHFDFVLVDTRLGLEEDGFAVARRMVEVTGGQRVLLLLETLDLGGDAARCRQAGVQNYLTKPLSAWELAGRLRQMAEPEEVAIAPPALGAADLETPRLSILVAEDNRINQLVTRKLLEKAGHQVQVVENGREALEALEEGHFDVALFDMQMPEMGGVEAVCELRRRERGGGGTRARTPVIAVTAHAMAGDRNRFLEAGIDDYLAKPIDAATLLGMIDRVTGHSVNRA